jgi:hypothetical protein
MGTPGNLKRRRRPRKWSPRILVVCGGVTEYNYFTQLQQQRKGDIKAALRIVKGHGGSAVDTVKLATKSRNSDGDFDAKQGDRVYCLIDVEPHAPATHKLGEACRLAKDHRIEIVLSNPSFEVWLLAHTGEFRRSFATPGEAEALLQQQTDHGKDDYNAKPEHMLPLISAVDSAITNARAVRKHHHRKTKDTAQANSSTDVYLLVEFLLGHRDDPP